jgi:DNA polymerase-3 subunit epsilon
MPIHDIYRDHDQKVYSCRVCGQTWVSTSRPATDCPGLKVYYWHAWPEGLYTKTQLGQKGYKPGQPVGVMHHRDRWMNLYRLEDATPKRQPTEAQRAALAKAQAAAEAARHCRRCTRTLWTKRERGTGLCEQCRDELRWLKDQAEVVTWAKGLTSFMVLDTETTGLDSEAEILQIAIIDQDGQVALDSYVKPQEPIDEDGRAFDVNGISNAMVTGAPSFADLYPQIAALLAGRTVVTYNVDFDRRMLWQACRRYDLPLIEADWNCAMVAYAEWYGDWSDYRRGYRWQPLDEARREFDLDFDGSHGALGDCRATLGLIKALASQEVEREQTDGSKQEAR